MKIWIRRLSGLAVCDSFTRLRVVLVLVAVLVLWLLAFHVNRNVNYSDDHAQRSDHLRNRKRFAEENRGQDDR